MATKTLDELEASWQAEATELKQQIASLLSQLTDNPTKQEVSELRASLEASQTQLAELQTAALSPKADATVVALQSQVATLEAALSEMKTLLPPKKPVVVGDPPVPSTKADRRWV